METENSVDAQGQLATVLADLDFKIEAVDFKDVKEHPENYQEHPDDQIEELRASIRRWGPFRNIILARDGTLLAGHGVSIAAKQEKWKKWPAKRYDLDPYDPEALALLAADNETGNSAVRNERGLVRILKQVETVDPQLLLGTGVNHQQLSNLDAVTRPPDEIQAHNENDHWVGMPEYEPALDPFKITIQFETDEARQEFLAIIGAKDDPTYYMIQTRKAISMWWPLRNVKADRKNAFWADEAGEIPEDIAELAEGEEETEVVLAAEAEEIANG